MAADELIEDSDSALGLLKNVSSEHKEPLRQLNDAQIKALQQPTLLAFAKSGHRSNIHRSAYADVIIIKRFNEQGQMIGGYRIVGLYTSVVYNHAPHLIPVVRKKIEQVLSLSGFASHGHNYKELMHLLNTYPRDELIQAEADQILAVLLEVLALQERKQVRQFMRLDAFGQFATAVVYTPKDVYSTKVRENMQRFLQSALPVEGSDFTTTLSESVLARSYFVFKLHSAIDHIDVDALEEKIIALARLWNDDLDAAMVESFGEEEPIVCCITTKRRSRLGIPNSTVHE